MMENEGNYHYKDFGEFQALSMPYKGSNTSMIIFLPDEITGIKDFGKNLDGRTLSGYCEEVLKTDLERIKVRLPKFKTECTYNLINILRLMGIENIFSPDAALTKISEEQLTIENALHKAYIVVDEEGTEAAAVTAITIKLLCYVPEPDKVFNVDHPFMFVIRENSTGAILFIGRLIKPENKPTEQLELSIKDDSRNLEELRRDVGLILKDDAFWGPFPRTSFLSNYRKIMEVMGFNTN
jgi:serpin B